MLTAYRAVIPGIAALCSFVAFILALCCLLAGTNPATLQGMELYTLNSSRIATTLVHTLHLPPADASFNISSLVPHADLNSSFSGLEGNLANLGNNLGGTLTSLGKNPKSALDGFKNNITKSVDEAKQDVSDVLTKAEGALKNATGKIVSTFINETLQSFHIHDFYIGHLLTYCEGNYTAKGKQNLTYCSNGKPNDKHVEPKANGTTAANSTTATKTLTDDNPLNVLKSLHLPDPIEYAFKALTLLTKIISAFYIVGTITLFLSLVSAALTIPAYFAPPSIPIPGRERSGKRTLLRWTTLACTACAFSTLFLASTMVHFLIKKLCGLVAGHPGSGVAAYPGKTFQGCSWAAVVLAAIAMMVAVGDVAIAFAGKRAEKRLGMGGKRKWWGGRKEEEEGKGYEI
ncbi:MAG: hypothetical protein Q9220_006225 [cf. Caloplaca sp. 1 TL-2023]